MRNKFFILLFPILFSAVQNTAFAQITLLPRWAFLWSGSWEHEKNLVNRADLRLTWQNFSLRGQLIDKSSAEFWNDFNADNFAFSGGIYHEKSNIRFLYGVLDEWGLSARLRRPWSRSVPFSEVHSASLADLKTEPSSTKEEEIYLYIESPQWGMFRGFTSLILDKEFNPAITGGFNINFSRAARLRLETFYTGRELPERTSSSWFSATPPLPERDFHLYALSLHYTSVFFAASTDIAYSDTFAYGQDLYANLGIRFGHRPWRASFAIDGAGNRFVGRDGYAIDPAFRLGTRFEYFKRRNEYFRFSTTLRSAGLGEPFERSSTLFYYRFPTDFSALSLGDIQIQPMRVSLSFARNASNPEKTEDKAEGSFAFNVWQLRPSFSVTVIGSSHITEKDLFPFPVPDDSSDFKSANIAGEVSYNFRMFRFRTKLGYTVKKDKDAVWDTAFHASAQGRRGRFTLSVASPDFPQKWTYTISWRTVIRGGF